MFLKCGQKNNTNYTFGESKAKVKESKYIEERLFCPFCQGEIRKGMIFCPSCGENLK